MKVTHFLIPAWTTGGWGAGPITHGATLWCKERGPVPSNAKTTNVKTEVTCKRCIAAGGCGPDWRGK